eukprot:1157817-Pelagomonas_calceolata.AAC.15
MLGVTGAEFISCALAACMQRCTWVARACSRGNAIACAQGLMPQSVPHNYNMLRNPRTWLSLPWGRLLQLT